MMKNFIFFLTHHKYFSKLTVLAYSSDIKLFLSHNQDFNIINIYTYLDNLNISHRTKARKIAAFKAYAIFLKKNDIANQLLSYKYNTKLPNYLSKHDVDNVLNCIQDEQMYLLVYLLFSTGLRISEALSLQLNQICNSSHTKVKEYFFIKSKRNKEKIVIIPKSCQTLILDYIQHKNIKYLFQSKYKCTSISRYVAFHKMKNIANINPHLFRHSFATHLLESNVNIRVIQNLLAHQSLNTTQIYTHIKNKHIEDILEKHNPLN